MTVAQEKTEVKLIHITVEEVLVTDVRGEMMIWR